MADAAAGADLADDGEDDVLGRDAVGELAVDRHAHPLRPRLRQRLGGQNVLDLAGADAEGERAERAVRRGVAVAAHDRHARQRAALLGSDDVDDALPGIAHREVDDAELRGVLAQHLDLAGRDRIGDRLVDVAVGTLWSSVATVRSGRRTPRPESRRPSNACGLVTSWTRCRSMYSRSGSPGADVHDVAVPHLLRPVFAVVSWSLRIGSFGMAVSLSEI